MLVCSYFRNQATGMTLKSFISAKKNAFFRPGSLFCTGISIIGPFPLRLYCVWAYRACHIWLYST